MHLIKISHFKKVLSTAVFWSFLTTALRFGGLLLVLPVMLRCMPGEQLGLWYVFIAAGALGILVDAGFNATVSRSVSYAWSGATGICSFGFIKQTTDPLGHNIANMPNAMLLSQIVGTMRVYYRYAAVSYFVLLGTVGTTFICGRISTMIHPEGMIIAWLLFCFSGAVSMLGSFWPSLLTGINGVREGQIIFFQGLVINYGFLITGLLLGFGIWALIIAQLLQGVYVRVIGCKRFRNLANEYISEEYMKMDFDIIITLWPMAWRALLVAVGSFLILQANTLICSSFLGLEVTASYGLTMQAITALFQISGVWLAVKWPTLNQFRISGELDKIKRIFIARLRFGLLTFVFGGITMLATGNQILYMIGAKTEFIATPVLAILLVFQTLEFHHWQFAALVLSENRNPFVGPALVSGVGIVLLSLALTPAFGLLGLVISFGLIQISFNNWWTVKKGLESVEWTLRDFTAALIAK